MKHKLLISATIVLALALSSGAALAFHDGGVAYCAGCHTMHNSQNGNLVDVNHPAGNAYLLNNGNASDTCLKCHAAYGQFAGGFGWGAGGDFYWVTKTFSWTTPRAGSTQGYTHGHNIVSPAYGIVRDPVLAAAPGGDFDSQYLTCTSCHDPHGNENYRLLYGDEGTGPIYGGARYDFDSPAPIALGNSRRTLGNSPSGVPETDLSHTVYKSGMSEWCANCHTDLHAGNTTDFVHPTGEDMGSLVAATYNAYISTDETSGGDPATSYRGLVPFEAVNVDLETIDPLNYTQGPTPQDQVMCLTCHRSHASPFADAGRWDFTSTHLISSHPQATDVGASADDVANKDYGYTLVTNQRSLCNKCHVKDFGDAHYDAGGH
ncbi:MAG: hypothetical protein IPI34_12330 [bacterium]|nr:hypothetical protein [bacterium]